MNDERILKLAVDIGEIILESGGEIYRVEDTMQRVMAMAGEYAQPEAAVFSTGIFASLNGSNGQITKLKRVKKISTNLLKLDNVNTLSRRFVSGAYNIDDAECEIIKIRALPDVKPHIKTIAIAISCFFFTLIAGSGFIDAFISFLIGIFLGIIIVLFSKVDISDFILRFICGATLTIFALILYKLNICKTYDKVIIGCIMPLLPGVTMTNAIRDILNGDFISGTSKIIEAIIIAVALASGVGISLKALEMI